MSTPRKLGYLALGLLLAVLGVIGLILPILPGVLFLLAAVLVVSKASTRVKRFADSDPRLREARRRFDSFARLGVRDRLRLAGWMSADALVRGAEALATGVASLSRAAWRRAQSY